MLQATNNLKGLLGLVILVVVISIGVVVVPAALGIECVFCSAISNALVLGVTAVVVVFYTAETRRMAASTEDMATATRDALEENRRLARSTEEMARGTRATLEQDRALRECQLDLRQRGTSIFRVRNLGPGRAKVLSLAWHAEEATKEHPDLPFVLEPGALRDFQRIPDNATRVSFRAHDDLGREYQDEVQIRRR